MSYLTHAAHTTITLVRNCDTIYLARSEKVGSLQSFLMVCQCLCQECSLYSLTENRNQAECIKNEEREREGGRGREREGERDRQTDREAMF